MKKNEMHPEMAELENLLKSRTEMFDQALKKNSCLDELRKLFHELRILKEQVDALYKQTTAT
jgi:hypothetical protein